MKSWMLALLIPLMLFSPTVRADDLRAEMEGSNKQWLEAFNTPSIASFPAMYTEDAILIPGGMAPAVPGPEAITKFWEVASEPGSRITRSRSLRPARTAISPMCCQAGQ